MWTERQVEKYTQAKEFSYIVLMCTIFFFFKIKLYKSANKICFSL